MSKNEHKARKRFGQNFLVDENVIRRIARAVKANASERLIEIGPGQGALTEHLLRDCPQLNAIELDRDLIPILRTRFFSAADFQIHEGDALKFDFRALYEAGEESKLRVVGNLPYNISTPLLFKLLKNRDIIQDMHFMLQKEVVVRLNASAGDKNYGRLSVMTQYYCEVQDLFDVSPESFNPRPKVNSAIVRLTPHTELPVVADNVEHFAHVVNLAFQQRRKTLRNALKTILENVDDSSLAIDLSLRAERLTVADFVQLSNQINAQSAS